MRADERSRIVERAAMSAILLAASAFVLQVGLTGSAREAAIRNFHGAESEHGSCKAATSEVVWAGLAMYDVGVREDLGGCFTSETVRIRWTVFGWVVVGRFGRTIGQMPDPSVLQP